LCGGGGDEVYHSRVSACQGSLPTRSPLRRVFRTLIAKRRNATLMMYEPIVEARL
jgi:hypothetical protein